MVTLTSGTGSGQVRYISDYIASSKVATVYQPGIHSQQSSTGYKVEAFAADAVNNYAQVTNLRCARYVEFVSATVMKAVTEVPFTQAQLQLVTGKVNLVMRCLEQHSRMAPISHFP